jgi:arylsulfatase A
MWSSKVLRAVRFTALCHLLIVVCLDAPAQSVRSRSTVAGPPNVIIILADDLGYGDVGFLGATDILTPNIDRLATEGVLLSSFYTAPSCSLSRTMLITGSYAPRLSASRNYTPSSRVGIHPDEVSLAELFRSGGYVTGIFGKWHLGDHYQFRPQRHGFDEYYGIPYSNDMWPFSPTNFPTQDENPRTTAARERCELTGCAGFGSNKPLGEEWPNIPLYDGDAIVEFNSWQDEFGAAFFTKALDFIERNAGRPFFAYLPLTAPHVPLHPSAAFLGASQRDLFGDTAQEMDFGVGRILDKLVELGIDDNTLVIFLSDNGPWLEYGIDGGSAGPLRGGKESHYEGGIRVPAALRWPSGLVAGGQVDEPVSLVDILPTLASIAGFSPPSDRTLDGVDVWPVITGQSANRPSEAIFSFNEENFGVVNLSMIRKGQWKLHVRTQNRSVTPVALYDLENDLGETTDRKSVEPAVVADLVSLGEQLVADILDNQRPLGEVILTGEPFAQNSGLGQMIAMEAENYHEQQSRGGQSWQNVSLRHSSSDESLQALPNNGVLIDSDYENLSPRVGYRANFDTADRYYVWARARGANNSNDSLHIGLDGQAPLSGKRMEEIFDYWGWTSMLETGGRAFVDVTSVGVHTLDVWMREDGVIVDKFILTTDANFTPSGQGLVESQQKFVAQQIPPTANDDGPYAVDEGGAVIGLFNVLDNDTDPDTANLNAVLVNPPNNSALFELRPDGTFDYTHDGGETSADSFTYRADDGLSQSNVAMVSFTINPINDAPVLTRNGSVTVNIVEGDAYADAGATAFDAEEGDISGDVVVGGDVVDSNAAGTYVIAYDVTDSDGAAATQVTRTVNVAVNSRPVITLNGSATVNIIEGYGYTDVGATAIDVEDGDISANILVGGDAVDANTPGAYVVTYDVTDSHGAAAQQVTRTVIVAVNSPPVITLNGDINVTLIIGDSYTDAGAAASDLEDGDISANIMVGGDVVDTAAAGTYVITYNVSDSAGKTATEVTRTVIVQPFDLNPPVITLIGSATVAAPLWVIYTDAGATAMDAEDGDMTSAIVVGGDTVDTGLIGTYVLTYNVSDTAGNAADEVTRTVIVPVPESTRKKRNKGGGSFGLGDLLLLLAALLVVQADRRRAFG